MDCRFDPSAQGAMVVLVFGVFGSIVLAATLLLLRLLPSLAKRTTRATATGLLILQRLFVLVALAGVIWGAVLVDRICSSQVYPFNRALVALFSLALLITLLDFLLLTTLTVVLLAVLSRIPVPFRERFEACLDPESVRALRDVGVRFLGAGRYPSQFPEECDEDDEEKTTLTSSSSSSVT